MTLSCQDKENGIKEGDPFLIREIKRFKPKKILELGVYCGETSKLILDALDSCKQKLYSIDIEKDINIGAACPRADNWWLFLGEYPYVVLDQIDKNIDFVYFNNRQKEIPDQIVDFLMIYPFLAQKSCIVINNLNIYFNKIYNEPFSFTPRILFATLDGMRIYDGPDILKSNIASITIDKKRQDFISLLQLLGLPWTTHKINTHTRHLIKFFERFYPPEFVEQYQRICALQMRRYEHSGLKRIKKPPLRLGDPLTRGG